jgi:hypothetical protein
MNDEEREAAGRAYVNKPLYVNRSFMEKMGMQRHFNVGWDAHAALAVPAGKGETEQWREDVAKGTGFWVPETGEWAPAETIVETFNSARRKAHDYDQLMVSKAETPTVEDVAEAIAHVHGMAIQAHHSFRSIDAAHAVLALFSVVPETEGKAKE